MSKKTYKLEEILEIQRGGSPRPIKKYITNDPDGINWIKIGDTKNSPKYITETKEKIKPTGVSKSRMVVEGDFLLSNSMSFGRPYIMKTRGCIHDGWLLLRKKDDEIIDDEYLYYILGSPLVFEQFKKLAKGTTVKNLNIQLVSKVEIPLPSLTEQKAIVAKLDRAQRLIDIDREMLAKYDELIQSVFLEMFGDPITNSKGWEVKKLRNISTAIFNGTTPKGGKKVYVEEGILFLRSQNVWRNRLDLEDVAYIDKETHERMKRSSLKKGDILMTKTGRFNTENSSLGRAAMYTGEDG